MDATLPFEPTDRYLTLSFAADGTDIAGAESSLFATLDQQFDRQQWRTTLLKAFQTWSSVADIDVGVVGDDPESPFGTDGPSKGDERFGDIRVGGRPLADNAMAISVDASNGASGSWAADVLLNSQARFSSLDDLFSVALHEAGHVFGLPHSADPASPMHVHGVSQATDLTPADIQAMQTSWGISTADAWEGPAGNDQFQRATTLEPIETVAEQPGSGPAIAFGEITQPGDVDYYRLEAVDGTRGPLTVRLVTSGISLLAPSLTLFDPDGTILFETKYETPPDSDIAHQVTRVDGDAEYIIRVQAGTSGAFSVGDYTLLATFDDLLQVEADTIDHLARTRLRRPNPDTVDAMFATPDGLLNDDLHSDDSAETATELSPPVGFEHLPVFDAAGSISDESDVDYFRFSTPEGFADRVEINAAVRSLSPGGLIPRVELLDEDRLPVATRVLVNGGGVTRIQASASPDKEYFVRVAGTPLAGFARGNYQLAITFSDQPIIPSTFFEGQVGTRVAQQATKLYIGTPQLIHFILQANKANVTNTVVMLRITNESGEEVQHIAAHPGETRTAGSVLLMPGIYFSQVLPVSLDISPINIGYSVGGLTVSDPFAVDPENPSDAEFVCPDVDGLFCYPGGVMSEKPFLWSDFLDQLPELPSLDGTDLHSALLGDWWQWYWQLVQDNAPPLTEADAYSVLSGNVLQVHAGNGVLANDQDFDSPLITALLAEAPLHGTVELSVDGGFTYRPENLFTGSDTFAYRAFDLRSTSPSTTVTITVESDLPIAGDFNGDGVIDVRDVDQLATAIRTDLQSRFDLNDDGLVDHSDLDYLVTSILHSTAGDANLDGRFDVADLISVFQAGQYEDERPDNSGWASGDWNGDGEFDSADLLEAFQAGSFVRASVRTSRWLIGAALAD